MRLRKKPNLAARLEKCSHLLADDPASLRGRWIGEPNHSELHVELGCGMGRFTVEKAKEEPDVFFAALEKSANVMVAAIELAANEELRNIRFINAFADYLPDFFAQSEVSRIYINFCDPWPARRHEKRRLTSKRFLELYCEVLCPGGEIHFKTDNLPLFEYSLLELERCGFELIEEARDLHKNGPIGVMTDYEAKFYQQGKPIYMCVAKKGG